MGFLPWIVLILSVAFRMLGISRPLLGNFAVYQTAYAMIARFFAEEHFKTIFYPQVNILVNGKPALHLLYYPISALIAALGATFLGGPLDFWGRLQSVLFYGGSSFYLYRFVKTFLNSRIALASLIAFAIAPLTIIYGQSFQHEMATVFFTAAFFYYWLQFLRKRRPWHFILTGFFLSWILLTRPNNLYIFLPSFYLAVLDSKSPDAGWKNIFKLGFVSMLGFILPALWYFHTWRVSYAANNIYSTMYAQLMVRSSFVSPLALHGEYYKALLDLLTGNVCTPVGFTLFLIGMMAGAGDWKKYGFFMLWSLSFLASSLLIPRKLIDHEFYLLHFLLPAAPLMGLGFQHIYDHLAMKASSRKMALGFFIAACIGISLRYAVHPAFKTPDSDKNILKIAEEVKAHTSKEKDRLVVQGTHVLLYYADRYGWEFRVNKGPDISDYMKYMNWEKLPEKQWKKRNDAFKDPITGLEYLREYDQATHFVVNDPPAFEKAQEFASYMHAHYPVLFEKKGLYTVFDLTRKL